jgi:hypothetical protein
MLFSRFAQSVAALLLLTIGITAPVHAQNNKQIISGTWYEDRATTTTPVSDSSMIVLTFAQTPSNQFLNITSVSCFLEMAAGQSAINMFLNAGSTSGAQDVSRPYFILGSAVPITSGGTKYYSIVNQIYYKFGPGRFPAIEIDTVSTASFLAVANCVIVGNLTDN